MSLLVPGHLQPVLDRAEEAVGPGQFGRVRVRDGAQPAQYLQPGNGLLHPQLGCPPAGDELVGAEEELDLTDAARAELDVLAGDPDALVAMVAVYARLHGVDVLQRHIIKMLAPDEGLDPVEEAASGIQVAANRPRLDHGGALPVQADALVVDFRRVG